MRASVPKTILAFPMKFIFYSCRPFKCKIQIVEWYVTFSMFLRTNHVSCREIVQCTWKHRILSHQATYRSHTHKSISILHKCSFICPLTCLSLHWLKVTFINLTQNILSALPVLPSSCITYNCCFFFFYTAARSFLSKAVNICENIYGVFGCSFVVLTCKWRTNGIMLCERNPWCSVQMVQNLSMLWSHNIQFTSTPTHNSVVLCLYGPFVQP